MTFFSWPTALIFASIAVPLLLLLYFLKLKRQDRKISSTLLWKKAVQDLQVNAPFQKLRRNLLLFLQLLILAGVLLAIAKPVGNFRRQPERNIVLLIDRSGSMKTLEADGRPRLAWAQDAAEEFVSNLPDRSRTMVISFANRANVVCSFTNDKRRLARLIREIEPTDAASNIGEALQLSVAYSSSLVDENRTGVPDAAQRGSADIEFFSDGRIADADQEYVLRGQMLYHRIGAAVDNVGIVGFAVRRDYDRPGLLSVFAEVENFGPTPVESDISLLLNGELLHGPGSIHEVRLGPAARTSDGSSKTSGDSDEASSALPARETVVFEISHEDAGIVEVRLHREDALAIDNSVSGPIDPPREVRILVVSDRVEAKYFLAKGFKDSLEIKDYTVMEGGEYENAPDEELVLEGRSAFDLVVLDRHDTDRLPPGNYVFLGGLPIIEGVARGDSVKQDVLVVWDERHPLLRSVQLDDIMVTEWKRLTLPRHAHKLIEGKDSTVMAFITDPGHRYVITAFDILDSNLPMDIPFPILLQNMVMYLAGSGLVEEGRLIKPGHTVNIPVPPGAEEATVKRPDGLIEKIVVRDRHALTYAGTGDVGAYKAEFDDALETAEVFAVNSLDANESNIAPNNNLTVGTEAVDSVSGTMKVNEPLWPYLAGAALLILLVEWWVYNRRVMI
ncbi:MAG: VWA domain-containing protein [Planctomycetota bacterium]